MKLKYAFLLFATITLFNSCKKNQDPELVSKWKLIEQLMDPGDGSGVFTPVISNKTIEFFEDGTITSNSILCQMSSESGTSSSGMYSESELSITLDNCGISSFVIYYEIDGSILILNYPCFEACKEKYELVE